MPRPETLKTSARSVSSTLMATSRAIRRAYDAAFAVLDLNLTSTFVCTRVIGGAMVARGAGGRVINIASINALVAGQNIGVGGEDAAGVDLHRAAFVHADLNAVHGRNRGGHRHGVATPVDPGVVRRSGKRSRRAQGIIVRIQSPAGHISGSDL